MTLMPVAEAQALIVSGVEPLDAEHVPIFEAAGRVLAEDLKAKLTQPPFDSSAMDGYAVRAADAASVPVRLKVIGCSAAGGGFAGGVGPGQAVRIFTGAPVPAGTDAIVIQEDTAPAGDDEVDILQGARPGRHIRLRGCDFSEGEVLLAAGTELRSRQLMLAASMNHAAVPVTRKPVVAILANGDELVEPGEALGEGQIVSSIPAGVKAAIEAWGGKALLPGLARDARESLAARIREASAADILLTIGGASVGEHDLVRATLEEMGATFKVLKAAIRPGKPVMSGVLGEQRVLSLPGNPVSAFVCARVFLKPMLDSLLGRAHSLEIMAPLAAPVEANGEREHYIRATLSANGVTPIAEQDSSVVSALASADCFLVRPVKSPALPAGARVPVLPLDF
jgi:molybdopterin molybdotransferase